jgi:chitodextrinase
VVVQKEDHMWRFLLRIAFVFSLVALFAQCGTSGNSPGEQAQIPASNSTVTFQGSTWSDVVFKHAEHSDHYHGECIKCHDHEPIAGETHWYCRTCHTAGQDRENLCNEVSDHGCVMTQCDTCHKAQVPPQAPPKAQNCTACHTGGQIPQGDVQAPIVPAGLNATAASSSQIDLSWTASTDNVGVAGYKIYRGGVHIISVSGTSTSDTGLAAGTSYCYQVSAYDAANNESFQSTVVCATTNLGADPIAPTVPTGLTATAVSSTQTDLSWTASTDNVAVVGYKIYSGGVYLKSVAGTSTSDTGLHCYQITAYDGANNESAKTTQVCTPGAVGTGTQIVLQDTVSQASEVDHWTLTVDTGTIVIDVGAWESCGAKAIPMDFFGDGDNNNKLHANIYLFDQSGALVGSATGIYSGDSAPGAHLTRSGQNAYLSISVTAGTYILAIGSYPLSQTNAWAGVNMNGSDWSNPYSYNGTTRYYKYKITITLN